MNLESIHSAMRNKRIRIISTVCVVITVIAFCYYCKEIERKRNNSFYTNVSSVAIVILLGTLFHNVNLFINEWNKNSIQGSRIIKLLYYVFLLVVLYSRVELCYLFIIINIPIYLLCITIRKITVPELSEVCENLQLNVGRGLAYNYYYNYLAHFIPDKFVERIRRFCHDQQVTVPEKLYILLPTSCFVKKFIENDRIERSRELPQMVLDVAGIKKRVYNITVYQVFKTLYTDYFRCAVEYAQPLRQLWELKENNKITLNQMYQERLLFIKTLEELLQDENESYKSCILVKYTDEYEDNCVSVYNALIQYKNAETYP